MKKEYVKPYVMVEFFQLDAAIASSCTSQGKDAIHHGLNSCTLEEEAPGALYIGASCEVNVTLPGGDENDGFCYHAALADVLMNS